MTTFFISFLDSGINEKQSEDSTVNSVTATAKLEAFKRREPVIVSFLEKNKINYHSVITERWNVRFI